MSVMDYDDIKRARADVTCSCGRKFFARVTNAEYEERAWVGKCTRCGRRGFMLIMDKRRD